MLAGWARCIPGGDRRRAKFVKGAVVNVAAYTGMVRLPAAAELQRVQGRVESALGAERGALRSAHQGLRRFSTFCFPTEVKMADDVSRWVG
jgi:hypothetical protein